MEELPQDLASALEESELRQDIDDVGDLSVDSSTPGRDLYRKRKTRKRRTVSSTNSHLVSSLLNNLVVVKQINNSPGSSSSLDEAVKDYVENLTANCSDESDEYMNSLKSRLENAVLSSNLQDRGHHRRVFKQASPCCCESDSYNENGSTLPVLRRHRRKKIKRMTIDGNIENGKVQELLNGTSDGVNNHIRKKPIAKGILHMNESNPDVEKMSCKTTKQKKERRLLTVCLLCSQKPCGRSNADSVVANSGTNNEFNGSDSNSSLVQEAKASRNQSYPCNCPCRCHTFNPKDESSISSTSGNSDTDSANFTQDDVGREGDDEMTDFYAESEGGAVWGVPSSCELPWWVQRRIVPNPSEEFLYPRMEDPDVSYGHRVHDSRVRRFVNGAGHISDCSYRGFHARNNRLPGMAARSVRRGRRRSKLKKTKKDKASRDQELYDFHASLSKLSLSARNKRRKLEDSVFKDLFANRIDWTANRMFPSCSHNEPNGSRSADNSPEIAHVVDNVQKTDSNAGTSSTTPTDMKAEY